MFEVRGRISNVEYAAEQVECVEYGDDATVIPVDDLGGRRSLTGESRENATFCEYRFESGDNGFAGGERQCGKSRDCGIGRDTESMCELLEGSKYLEPFVPCLCIDWLTRR